MTGATPGREVEIWAQLDRVTDPEIDEPITSLGFVTSVAVDGSCVRVDFRLPTYWCAANFAFLMADDIRREVSGLPWVRTVTVELGEHMYAETINAGIREGRSFQETFGPAASEDLGQLRRIFARKSFLRRQERALQALLRTGHSAAAAVALTAGEFNDTSPAFVDEAGQPLSAAMLFQYLRRLRSITVNMEFNGALCRGLLAARFGEDQPNGRGTELRDFVGHRAKELR
jgi:metal-sulfur cluster biosynthetic enzyme